MSGLHPKSIEILAQVAAKIAGPLSGSVEHYEANFPIIYASMVELIEREKAESTWQDPSTFVPAPLDDGTAALAAAFPGSTPVAPQAAPAVRPNPSGRTQIKVFSRITVPGEKDDRGGPLQVPNPSWLEAKALADGVKELWDNRSDSTAFGGKTENGNRPWFKEKLARDASDEEKKAAKAYWPPRDSTEGAADYVHPSFANAAPAADEESF